MVKINVFLMTLGIRFINSMTVNRNIVSGIYWVEGIAAWRDAELLSQKLQLPITNVKDGVQLSWNIKKHLELSFNNKLDLDIKSFSIDFLDPKSVRRQQRASTELICKAMGKLSGNPGMIWDLTAGLGRDSTLLVSYGWRVHLFERNPILGVLLEDAIQRIISGIPLISDRMELTQMDAISYKQSLTHVSDDKPYAVYLDPMYAPNFIGKDAKVKKETQILHHIIGNDEGLDDANNKNLFEFALNNAESRVVVKRPLRSPPLAGAIPHSSIMGSSQRFDVYFQNRKVVYNLAVTTNKLENKTGEKSYS
eukprot:gene10578-22072_t